MVELLLAALTLAPAEPVPVVLDPTRVNQCLVTEPEAGTREIRTTGEDPYVQTLPFGRPFDPGRLHVLEFEYFCPGGLDLLEVFFHPAVAGRSVRLEGLPTAEGWSSASIDLAEHPEWAQGWSALRLDFGTQPDKTIRVRNLRLREPTAAERQALAEREARQARALAFDATLADYLATAPASRIEWVNVTAGTVTVRGVAAAEAELGEIPLWADALQAGEVAERVGRVGPGAFEVTLPRRVAGTGPARDRLYRRWRLFAPGQRQPVSRARWADEIACDQRPERLRPRSPKGLGAGPLDPVTREDYRRLGIANMTYNLTVASFLRSQPGEGRLPHEFEGRTWYLEPRAVAGLDAALQAARDDGIVISAILLVQPPPQIADPELKRRLPHPDWQPAGIYAHANVTDADGVEAHAALLDFLAERYSRPDQEFGRITHWIIGNEVDQGWVWTNAGRLTMAAYLELHQRWLRLVSLTIRRHNPAGEVFISLTHHWTAKGRDAYASREMLEQLCAWGRAEGDFPWGVAYHPYPENLRNPRTWEDKQPTFRLDTPKITFRNLEVLDAWMRRPEMLHNGRPRTLLLSEQGLNSPDYSDPSLRDQAAGLAYAWTKIASLPLIEAFHYHRYIDHTREGGLRLGLWTVKPGTIMDRDTRKPAWEVYAAAGTAEQERVFAPYLPVVGLTRWSDALWREEIAP